jgi:hypothetical protein
MVTPAAYLGWSGDRLSASVKCLHIFATYSNLSLVALGRERRRISDRCGTKWLYISGYAMFADPKIGYLYCPGSPGTHARE